MGPVLERKGANQVVVEAKVGRAAQVGDLHHCHQQKGHEAELVAHQAPQVEMAADRVVYMCA